MTKSHKVITFLLTMAATLCSLIIFTKTKTFKNMLIWQDIQATKSYDDYGY